MNKQDKISITEPTGLQVPEKDLAGETMHIRDVNSRDIFKNNLLTSQFLRDYSGFSIFADIHPEDIEDQTSRFRMLLGIEVEGDSVKKIHVKIGERSEVVYVISLIEHKSQVDYDVAMQIFHYTSVIWKDHARKANEKDPGASKRKGFRYPLIIPVVYYEGKGEWTAGLQLSDRIAHPDLAGEYAPDFRYKVVRLNKYGDEELKGRHNEMSLIMMINKIQDAKDFHQFRKTAMEYMEDIYQNTSEEIRDLILRVIWGLLMKMAVPEEEAAELIKNVKEHKDMGILFENFETFDYKTANEELRIAREELAEAKSLVKQAESRADQAESRADQAESRADQAESRVDKLEKELQELRESISRK